MRYAPPNHLEQNLNIRESAKKKESIFSTCSHLMMRWAAYWWRLRNWADMLASAARQLVWRYLSCSGWKHTNATRSHFCKSSLLLLATVPAYPRPSHVELDGADDHQDEQTAEGDLRQWPLGVPCDVLQYLWKWEAPRQLENDTMQGRHA